jgi:UDP-glucose 4-epimerase
MAILVTGGAGYIGCATVELLLEQGEQVVVLDDLSRGRTAAIDDRVRFYEGRTGDRELVSRITRENEIDSCIHFAAFAYVGESVEKPALYFENNVAQGIALLDSLISAGVRKFVFSSTCATYGEPRKLPLSEDHTQWPTNPYGWSKFFMERILESYDQAYDLKFVALRYFNAAGASEKNGEDHDPETHLIPNVLRAAQGLLPYVSVYGDDYPTADGTCVRDYIHISDLGDAHTRALSHLDRGGESSFINLGNGQGYSVLEVIEAARRVTGRPIEIKIEPRRPGDPSHLVADSGKALAVLGWRPLKSELVSIIESAWKWRLSHPSGYKSSR